jgi:methylase of polypeptide subunit release factors
MMELLPAGQAAELRAQLEAVGYTESGLEAACGVAAPPKRTASTAFLYATRDGSAISLLARAFLAALPVPAAAAANALPAGLLDLCRHARLWGEDGDALVPSALMVPVRGLLFASDTPHVLASNQASEFVLPAHTHAGAYLLDLTPRRPVSDTLDLGTGCGVQALHAAAHSERVVATDLNPRAVRYAEFNARLNGLDNVECLVGDLFAPVAGRTFDLIVSNPPFVPAPGRRYTYRDTGMVLDGLTRKLLREAPSHLRERGLLELLCEWVEVEGESWQDRIGSWLDGLGCDAWILRSPPSDPRAYAALRVGELAAAPSREAGIDRDYAEWIEYFAQHRVTAVHPGVIVLRRRQGPNWLHVQPLARELMGAAGDSIIANIATCDFLAAHPRAEDLLDMVFTPSPYLAIEQSHRRKDDGWVVASIRAWLTRGPAFDAELDPAAAALLREFDGSSTLFECLQRFAGLVGDSLPEVRRNSLPVVRFFLERGFLLPPGEDRR